MIRLMMLMLVMAGILAGCARAPEPRSELSVKGGAGPDIDERQLEMNVVTGRVLPGQQDDLDRMRRATLDMPGVKKALIVVDGGDVLVCLKLPKGTPLKHAERIRNSALKELKVRAPGYRYRIELLEG